MALPTLIYTWQFKTNRFVHGSFSQDALQRKHAVDIMNLLCDFVQNDVGAWNEGSFTFSTPTVTYTAPDNRFVTGIVGNLIGKSVRVKGATSAGNDGTFTITAQTDSTLQWSNASGVAESLTGSIDVIEGVFSNPWVVDHTGTTTVHGTPGDGINRLAGDHTRIGIGGTGNVGYWVIRNTVTGSYWAYSTDSDSNTSGFRAGRGALLATTAPNTILAPTALTGRPTGSLLTNGVSSEIIYNTNAPGWFNENYGSPDIFVHAMMSSDGSQTRLISAAQATTPHAFIDATVYNPHPDWSGAAGVPTPSVTCMRRNGAYGDEWSYGDFNDNARVNCSDLPWVFSNSKSPDGNLWYNGVACYLSCEGAGAAMNGQNFTGANELSGEWELNPVGIVSLTAGVRGRLGQLADVWFAPTSMTLGQTMPANTSRQFCCMGQMVLPWDGSIAEMG